MARLLTVLTMLALLVGTASGPVPAQEPAPPPAFYFPVQKGARWVYLRKVEGRKDEERVEVVTDVSPGIDGAKVVTVSSVAPDGRTWPSEKFEVSASGLLWKEDLNAVGGVPYPLIIASSYRSAPASHGSRPGATPFWWTGGSSASGFRRGSSTPFGLTRCKPSTRRPPPRRAGTLAAWAR